MQHSGKLELTWVGKYKQHKIEPRLLVEDKTKSYGDPASENMLIHGDNLIALRALTDRFEGTIKCIFIDPPYNTGNAFDKYDDGLEHSIWLNMMYQRLQLLYSLLSYDGFLFVSLDEREHAYAKVMMDEIFGRENFIGDIIWQKRKGGGNDSRYIALDHDYILVYAKNVAKEIHPEQWLTLQSNLYLKRYKETDNEGNRYYWDTVARNGLQNPIPVTITCPDGTQLSINSQMSQQSILDGLNDGNVRLTKGKNGWTLHHRVYMRGGQVQRSILNDVGTNKDAADEMSYLFGDKKSFPYPKPESLIARILELATKENDIVLDSFLGSGTTAAVAHKMRRRWIGIELGDHAYTHCKVRLDRVIDGTDAGGITSTVNWQGGGGYHFYELGPSLLVRNKKLPIYQINPEFTFEMLCEAICKIEGFKYAPNGVFHGHSSEKRFIHITKEFVNAAYIKSVTATLGDGQSLLIYRTKIQSDLRLPDNVEVKKIPKDLLEKCEFESEVR